LLVSFVLNRKRHDFGERDIERLELVREGLGSLYRHARMMSGARLASFESNASRWQLTARECEVLQWLARGKTDRDIGEILGISPRTVHKHLQRSYQKLGVETRTAAVMRAMALR
jgi:DNA-binding CsgD family transcriptional regulator